MGFIIVIALNLHYFGASVSSVQPKLCFMKTAPRQKAHHSLYAMPLFPQLTLIATADKKTETFKKASLKKKDPANDPSYWDAAWFNHYE